MLVVLRKTTSKSRKSKDMQRIDSRFKNKF